MKGLTKEVSNVQWRELQEEETQIKNRQRQHIVAAMRRIGQGIQDLDLVISQ